jgi:hypothetical protein
MNGIGVLHLNSVPIVSSTDWLNASVAIERAITAIKGVNFNKLTSKIVAKRVIPIIFIGTSISYLHHPLSRRLYDDQDEERTWCILDNSSKLKIYDRFINLVHFSIPFIINIVSTIIIIIQVFRIRIKAQKTLTHKTILIREIKRHKHLIIASLILTALAIPRLIILFLSGCMESPRDPCLFLIGYYISFVPSLIIFLYMYYHQKNTKKYFLML